MRTHIAHTPSRSTVEGVIVDTEREQQLSEHRVAADQNQLACRYL